MEFSRQEYRSGVPLPSRGDLPSQGLSPGLLYCRLYRLSHQGSKECVKLQRNEVSKVQPVENYRTDKPGSSNKEISGKKNDIGEFMD